MALPSLGSGEVACLSTCVDNNERIPRPFSLLQSRSHALPRRTFKRGPAHANPSIHLSWRTHPITTPYNVHWPTQHLPTNIAWSWDPSLRIVHLMSFLSHKILSHKKWVFFSTRDFCDWKFWHGIKTWFFYIFFKILCVFFFLWSLQNLFTWSYIINLKKLTKTKESKNSEFLSTCPNLSFVNSFQRLNFVFYKFRHRKFNKFNRRTGLAHLVSL